MRGMLTSLGRLALASLLVGACAPAGGGSTGTGGAGSGGVSPSGGASAGGSPGSGGSASGGASAGSGGATGATGGAGSGGSLGGGGAGTGGAGAVAGGMGSGGRGSTGGSSGSGAAGGISGGGHSGAGGGSSTGGNGGAGTAWVGTWTAAPQLTETANNPPLPLGNSTVRQVVRVSLGGSRIRVRFSNEFGNGPVVINQAHVAVCKANPVDSTIDTASDKPLSFAGMASATVASGSAIWSDALDFNVANLSNLSITTAFGSAPTDVTGHPGSRTTSYQQSGAASLSAANMTSAQKADHWYVISGVDVAAADGARGLVILGDSITDGRGSTTNGNDRWTDALAKRVLGNAATAKVAVMNQGIGGNAILTGGLGPPGAERYARDVLGQAGVRWVIVFEGVNDISEDTSVASITAAYDRMIADAHARNLLIYGATVTPFAGHSYYSVAHETARQAVNTYIRSGKFDAVIDLDAAVRDTSTPPKVQTAYDSGDGLHLNPTGYRKLADTVDLTLLTK